MPYKDKEKQKEASRRHYLNNADEFTRRSRTRRDIVRRTIDEIKQGKACKCGEDHPACLDFHHVDPNTKEAGIDTMRRDKWLPERIRQELAKCIIVCSNCHRKIHYEEVLARQNNR